MLTLRILFLLLIENIPRRCGLLTLLIHRYFWVGQLSNGSTSLMRILIASVLMILMSCLQSDVELSWGLFQIDSERKVLYFLKSTVEGVRWASCKCDYRLTLSTYLDNYCDMTEVKLIREFISNSKYNHLFVVIIVNILNLFRNRSFCQQMMIEKVLLLVSSSD